MYQSMVPTHPNELVLSRRKGEQPQDLQGEKPRPPPWERTLALPPAGDRERFRANCKTQPELEADGDRRLVTR